MRKIGIKVLRDNLSKELRDLPLAVSSDGQVVATICSVSQWNKLVREYEVATIQKPLEIYDRNRHKTGDRVLVRQGKKLVEMVVPETDGNSLISEE